MPAKKPNKARSGKSPIGRKTAPGGKPGATKQPAPEPEQKRSASRRKNDSRPIVVGLGASAGGFHAYQQFLEAMPSESGLAFVLVQHLDPTRKSLSVELFGKYTSMHVVQIEQRMAVRPNCVHVMPPDRTVVLRDGTFQLEKAPRRPGVVMPIDTLFRSLAEQLGNRAVGVVLSGTGTDGTLGLKAIQAAGGMTVAQEPAGAAFDGMPRSAINTGVVDHVLAAERIPELLIRYAQHPYAHLEDREPIDEEAVNGLQSIIALLRARTVHDFRCYKRSTLARRTQRRMGLLHIEEPNEYVAYLNGHPEEVRALVRDLLISVTDFYRDPDAWKALENLAIEPLVKQHQGNEPIRVWVTGCATGEEPYSVAMLILEHLQRAQMSTSLQVFATDVDEEALAYARNGIYPKSIAADVPPERLRRFFVEQPDDHRYQIAQSVRESVIFARQDLIGDPPFSRLDLITCRNLLIYLKPEVQSKLIALLHFALREGGILFLGNAETIGRHTDLFVPISKKWRIYRRVGRTRHDLVDFPIGQRSVAARLENEPVAAEPRDTQLIRLAQRLIADRYAPASVLINSRFEVLYFCGPTEDYLKQPSGPPTRELLALVREGLRARLRGAVRKASEENHTVTDSARVKRDDTTTPVEIIVAPVHSQGMRDLLLVVFRDQSATAKPLVPPPPTEEEGDTLVKQLEEELTTTREDLRSMIEQLETSNEELKSSNEEIMSMNEELQSSNEELETSKEELQSLNEELATVNNQLQSKLEELEHANNDLNNLLNASEIPTICLDRSFQIKWYTPATAQIVSLRPSDVGRPIADFAQRLTEEDLLRDAETVLRKLVPITKEVTLPDERWYMRRVLPYRTADDRIDGVVVTFTDVTRLKQAELDLRASRDYAESIVGTIREPLLVLDDTLHVISANRSFYELFQETPDDTEEHSVYELGNRQWDIPELRRLLEEILPQQTTVEAFEVDRDFPVIGRRTMLLNARRIAGQPAAPGMILLAIEDVTDRKRAEREIAEHLRRLETLAENAPDLVFRVDRELRHVFVNQRVLKATGRTRGQYLGHTNRELGFPEDLCDVCDRTFQAVFETRKPQESEFTFEGPTGPRYYHMRVVPEIAPDDSVETILGITRDVTEIRRAQEQLEKANRQLEQRVAERTGTLKLLSDVAAAANEAEDIEQALDCALRRVGEHYGWCLGHAYVLEEGDPNVLVPVRAQYDSTPERFERFRAATFSTPLQSGQGLPGRAYATGSVQWMQNMDEELVAWRADLARELGIRSGAAFPIFSGDDVVGVLEFFSLKNIERTDTLLESMASIGTQLGRVVERQLFERRLPRGLLDEQQRVGQDLHDTVGQELAGLALITERMAQQAGAGKPPEAAALTEVSVGLRHALETARFVVRGLVPPVAADAEGLVHALEDLAATMSRRYRVACEVDCPRPVSVGVPDVAMYLYRIAAEAMTNAAKHAQARRIVLRLDAKDDMAVLEVRDDGVGIPEDAGTRGSGLRIMPHRAKVIGGTLDIRPGPRGGTIVTCALPVAKLSPIRTKDA